MNYEELQQKVKRLEEQLTELRIKILESKADKKSYEVEVPEDIEDYVYINNVGNIYNLNTFTISEIEKIYKRGLAFETTEEAEQYDRERILLFKLHKWAEEHNEGWTPNWSDIYEKKHCIAFEKEGEIFDVNWCMCYRQFTKLPLFKSEEIAEQFIKEFRGEIEEVFC